MLRNYTFQADYIRVAQLKEVVKFAVGAFGIEWVLESINYFFDGDELLSALVACLVDYSIGALPYFLDNFKLSVYMVVNFLRLLH